MVFLNLHKPNLKLTGAGRKNNQPFSFQNQEEINVKDKLRQRPKELLKCFFRWVNIFLISEVTNKKI